MLTFAELRNRYVIRCGFDITGGWHIGTGRMTAETDAAVIRRAGKPFVPGSSLRGALRSGVERVARSLGVAATRRICTPFEGTSSDACAAANPDRRKRFELPETAEEAMADLLSGREYLCPVCRLFGSTIMAAKLRVGDGTAVGEAELRTAVRDGVAINRDTGAAQEKLKYDFEVADGGLMAADLLLENATVSDFALLYVLLEEWRLGMDIGGKRARGLGRMQRKALFVRYFDSEREFPLRDYLTAGELRREDEASFRPWLKEKFESFCSGEDTAC